MTEQDIVQAISINLLRMAEWYYKDPKGNLTLCQRYLDQSRQLRKNVKSVSAQALLQRLDAINFSVQDEPYEHIAERCLTLGVMLQHPHRWMKVKKNRPETVHKRACER